MALSKITDLSITDDTIKNADINSSAAIALTKLATDPSNASNLASGTVPTARLGTGSASSSVFLAGDSTWIAAGGGKIGQVRHFNYTTETGTTSDSYVTTGLTYTITPSATSSTVLIDATLMMPQIAQDSDSLSMATSLYHNGSAIQTMITGLGQWVNLGSAYRNVGCINMRYMHSPSSTSEQTYTCYFKRGGATVASVQIQQNSSASSMTLYEVLA